MSSFFVGNQQISKLANTLHRVSPRLNGDVASRLPPSAEELAFDLYKMNIDALAHRYQDWSEMVEPFEYNETLGFNVWSDSDAKTEERELAQMYQSMMCYLYQCSEGEVGESKLFKDVQHLHSSLAHNIARRFAKENGAKWE